MVRTRGLQSANGRVKKQKPNGCTESKRRVEDSANAKAAPVARGRKKRAYSSSEEEESPSHVVSMQKKKLRMAEEPKGKRSRKESSKSVGGDHVGGRKMTEAEFQEYNCNIVARDLELVSLSKDLRRLGQERTAVIPKGAQTEEEKARIRLKLRLTEWDTTFTELNIKRVLDHAQSLEGKLKSQYLS